MLGYTLESIIMVKAFKSLIGQYEVKTTLSEIIEARHFAERKRKRFLFPPLNFTGLSGTGKTYFAEAFATALEADGFRFEQLPIKPGWRYLDQLAQRVCQVNDDGSGSAIPTVFLVDEAHEPSPIEEMLKLITGCKRAHLFERNATKFFHDPFQHAWIFASNEDLDPAQKRRCMEIPFTSYTPEEKKELFTVMTEKPIAGQALDYLESRSKPQAGDVEQISRRLNLQPVDRITLEVSKIVIKHMGLFPLGLVRKDLELMLRMANDTKRTPIEALRAKIGDVKSSSTRNRLGWLMAMELVESTKGGYTNTKNGITYLKKLAEMQGGKKK